MTKFVNIDTVDKIKKFCGIASDCLCRAELHSGRYVIDAKSIMGVFSLNSAKPIQLEIEDCAETADFIDRISEFIVDEPSPEMKICPTCGRPMPIDAFPCEST